MYMVWRYQFKIVEGEPRQTSENKVYSKSYHYFHLLFIAGTKYAISSVTQEFLAAF